MKIIKIAVLLLMSFSTISAFSQDREAENVTNISFDFEEGIQRIKDAKGTTLVIEIKKSKVVKVSLQKEGGRLIIFKSTGNTRNSDCPCGHECWEDDSSQQSICICKPCGGGSGTVKLSYVAWDQGL